MAVDSPHHFTITEAKEFLRRGLFVAWERDLWLLAWGNYKWRTNFRLGTANFYLPDFFLESNQSWIEFDEWAFVRPFQLQGILHQLRLNQNSPRSWESPELTEFSGQFEAIQNRISAGSLNKAVPVVFEQSVGHLSAAEKKSALIRLTQLSEGLTPYGFWTENEGLIGASPEILFDVDLTQDSLTSMAIAGTKKNRMGPNTVGMAMHRDENNSLLDDPKEVYEHQIVVEDIKERLAKYGNIHSGETFEWSLGPLKHLRTDIEVKLDQKFNGPDLFEEVCLQLHPTPALGVAPRTVDWHWLKELPQENPRRRYGAPFGVKLPDGRSRSLVAIRNVQWFEGNCYLGSGCGIVPQSELNREWSELQLKRDSVKEALGL